MPAALHPLGSDVNGAHAIESWSYASVIRMLMYLASNSHSNIQYAVHQCARFTHNPRASHEQGILRICHYLCGTWDKGLVFKPSTALTLDCYVDADFAGLWNVEHSDDPVCVKSCTGYVLTLGRCPLIWASKLQSKISLSTTEAEYIALSQAMHKLLPACALLQEIGTKLGLSFSWQTLIQSKVWEDNNGALCLATEPTKTTLHTKHIAVKYHFFCSHMGGKIRVHKVDTTEQLADIFTKGLMADKHQVIASWLMGWDTDASCLCEPITPFEVEPAAALAHSSSHSVPVWMRGSEAIATQPGQVNLVTDAHTAQSGQANQTTLIQAHSILQHSWYSHSRCDVPLTPKSVIWTCLDVNRGHQHNGVQRLPRS